jgi:regulator of cell morphogenesis and NO signaling
MTLTSSDPTPTISKRTTLAEVVTAHPGSARTLEARGLDYCCHGERTIEEAAREAGLDPDAIVAELVERGRESAAEDWATTGPAELVDHLVSTHHRYLWEELPRLTALLAKVTAVHGARHPELVDVGRVLAELRDDLEPHLMKEERVLFPMIRELAAATEPPEFHCGRLANPISVMLMEHDRTGGILGRLRSVTRGFEVPSDACSSYRACFEGLAELERDTHLHIHKENHLLFPAVVALEEQLGAGGS